ncbi:hypothetical protein N8I77_006989 [Diaporthe amygdali]|uniref:Uncharacterized protein n=1 Tax=Phomopsis amygdali TaxID=1214568 RepID=A0AAD9W0Y6_PHOAM|nr:hypothetical protein N8I77_006989 [Diaporthe amygdali]
MDLFLISFEVLRGGGHDWQPHLSAVTSVIGSRTPIDVFNDSGCVSDALHVRQGLEFLVVNVLWFDILACISTGRAPQLPYKCWLDVDGLDTANLMGCQSWILAVIGDIASLKQWKDENRSKGSLSVRELASRAHEMEVHLEKGIERIDATTEAMDSNPQVRWVSRVFALAALVLLHVVVSGPIPTLPEIEDAVARGITAIQSGPCSSRGLVWAICVIGSMSSGGAQSFFEDLLTGLVRDSGRFGNSAAVLKILRKCWSKQKTSSIDCAAAMSELNMCALLI